MKSMKLMVLALAASLVGSRRGIHMRLANEAAKAATTRSAQHWKRRAAANMGKPELAESDDDTVDAACDDHITAMAKEAAAPVDDAGKTANEKTEENVDGKDAEALKLANEKVEKANKRAADLLIGTALTEGRILPAAKKDWEGKFANDFDGAETALKAETKKLNTTSRTKDLGDRSQASMANEDERRDKVMSLVNEEMGKNGGNYDLAFATVRNAHKELFGQMKQPEAKK